MEIFEHVSLMTLDTIMKCAFSYLGSHQADRSVKFSGTRPYFLPTGVDLSWEVGKAAWVFPINNSNIVQRAPGHSQIQPTAHLH